MAGIRSWGGKFILPIRTVHVIDTPALERLTTRRGPRQPADPTAPGVRTRRGKLPRV